MGGGGATPPPCDAGRLQVSLRDDGRGGTTARTGSGLAGLTDRVETHVGSILTKLGLPTGEEHNRRVLAVLTQLGTSHR